MTDRYWRAVHPGVRLVARLAGAPRAVPLDGAVGDLDVTLAPAEVTDTIAVVCTPRTGSNLLVRGLTSAGFGHGDEFWSLRSLWAGYVRWGVPGPTWRSYVGQVRRAVRREDRWWLHHRMTPSDFMAYQRLVEQHFTTANGTFTIKLFPEDVQRLMTVQGLAPDRVLAGHHHWVHLRRRDKVAQAVSHFRATSTDSWIDTGGAPSPEFDADGVGQHELEIIRERVDRFERGDAAWIELFERMGVQPIVVDYEDLDGDLVGALRAVVAPLGGTVDDDVEPRTFRQRDDANADVRRRFLERYPEYAP